MRVMLTAVIAAMTIASGSPAWSDPALSQPALSQPALSQPALSQGIWHATRALVPGDIIRQDDIVARPLPRPLPEAVMADQEIVGQQIKRRVSADRPLTVRDIGPRTAVQASTPVDVLWNNGPLKMEMSGRAMESGALGDEVRVLNPSSGRTIRGIVVGDSMVEIRIVQ